MTRKILKLLSNFRQEGLDHPLFSHPMLKILGQNTGSNRHPLAPTASKIIDRYWWPLEITSPSTQPGAAVLTRADQEPQCAELPRTSLHGLCGRGMNVARWLLAAIDSQVPGADTGLMADILVMRESEGSAKLVGSENWDKYFILFGNATIFLYAACSTRRLGRS
ncbi:hypothetical protein C8J57DRAFT_1233873 [Mycena rebaudengoi]|nr:hypothetical protein C8J57DRAFT_1233873 [Mycena rebaudengoi]